MRCGFKINFIRTDQPEYYNILALNLSIIRENKVYNKYSIKLTEKRNSISKEDNKEIKYKELKDCTSKENQEEISKEVKEDNKDDDLKD